MFKDLHCHLLPGVDDGAKTLVESIDTLKQAVAEGVNEIVLTPHYIENTRYNCNNKDKKELLKELEEELAKEGVQVKLYLGNEVFITENFIDLMEKREIMTINNSRYLLFEFPLNQSYPNSKIILEELVKIGCVPILAHPERYREFQLNPELAEEYVNLGVLLQSNYKSLFGKYGPKAKKALRIFLKKGLITFLSSDTHHVGKYDVAKARRKVKRIVKSNKIVDDLFCNNFDRVIRDEELKNNR